MFTPRFKRQLVHVLPFGVIWFFFGGLYALIEQGLLGDSSFYPVTGNPYNPNILLTAFLAGISGLLVGLIEIFYFRNWFNQKIFLVKVFYKTTIYLIIVVSIILINVVINNALELELHVFSEAVRINAMNFMNSYALLSVVLYMFAILVVCLFYVEASDNIGPELLFNIYTGKYHNPVEEERIFMFLDMKSSTAIAEKLGHTEYFKILKAYYADVSPPILKYAGEIYQYVGDEIVVTWDYKRGLSDNNCIRCFFEMKEALQQKASWYESKFGVTPSFKAGLHLGKVTSGEIGLIKKEIFFTGDVLNTAARIQSLCNSYEVDILISATLANTLPDDSALQTIPLGETSLRGRQESMALYTVKESPLS